MTTRIKRLAIVATVLSLACCSIAGWAAIKTVAWARDLPNRIVIDGDAVATSFGVAVTESFHVALRSGDPALQRQVINDQFIPAVAGNPDAATWIRDEYHSDLLLLVNSSDPAVSSAATEILGILELNIEDQRPQPADNN